MFRTALVILMTWLCSGALMAQLPTHTLSFTGDSLIYSNAPFKFVEVIDARNDTTKLGLLKEKWDADSYQLLNLPKELDVYLLEFLSTVVTHQATTTDVAMVVHDFKISEEPLGAIELAKSLVIIGFYAVNNGQYRLIREVNSSIERPGKEMTPLLSSQLELTFRKNVYDFLSGPTSEGETTRWLTRKELLAEVTPEQRLGLAPTGKITYANNKFWIGGERAKRKEVIDLLEQAGAPEIDRLIRRNRLKGWLSTGFLIVGTTLVVYPVWDIINSGGELNGRLIGVGAMSGMASLLLAKSGRHNMQQAISLFNKRFNE